MISSLLFLLGLNFVLYPEAETTPSPYAGDSVDDAAIWYHSGDPGQSVVLATLKASNVKPVQPTGILVYDLEGKQQQFLSGGTPNNIDLRPGFMLEGKQQPLIAASHWYDEQVGLYAYDPESRMLKVLNLFPTGVKKLRGLCMAVFEDRYYYFAVGSSGDIEQYEIISQDEVSQVNRWHLGSEAEGCVADDVTGYVYIAEENVGIWRLPVNPELINTPETVDRIRFFGPLARGLEGMDILTHNTARYLVVSVQEKSRFAIYQLPGETYLGSFSIRARNGIDGVSKTDGIAIMNKPLGSQFPSGLIVVQDNTNESTDGRQNQNFKYVSRQQLTDALEELSP